MDRTDQEGTDLYEREHAWQRKCFKLICGYNNFIPFEYIATKDTFVFTRYRPDGVRSDFVLPTFSRNILSSTAHNRDNAKLFNVVLGHLQGAGGRSQFECRIDFPTSIDRFADKAPSEPSSAFVFDEGPRWWHISLASVDEGTGGFSGIVGIAADIQKEKEQRAELALSAKMDSSFLQSMTADSLIAMEFDMETGEHLPTNADRIPSCISADIKLASLIELLSDHATSIEGRTALNGCFDPAVLLSVREKHSGMVSFDCQLAALDGTSSIARWYGVAYRYVYNMQSDHIELLIQVIDIDDRKSAELALEEKMTVDPLTGLLNRSTFERRCTHEIDEKRCDPCVVKGAQHALAFIRIDALERINDAYGHMFGDRMLQSVADMMRAMARENELLVHLEGARFAMFSTCLNETIIAERSKIFFAALATRFADEITTTASIGIAMYPKDAQTYRSLSERADLALYRSCREGGGRYTFYSPELDEDDRLRYVSTLTQTTLDVRAQVHVRTFGYFDVFVSGQPVVFHHAKSKELLALLVDRRGGYLTSTEAISYLWENETADKVTLSRYRKVAMRLKNILVQYGVDDIMEVRNGSRRIVPEKVDCDLFNYLSGVSKYAGLFKGEYMSNYSWGENTLATLL